MITGEDVLCIKYSNYKNIGKHERKKMKRFLHLFENRKKKVLKLFFLKSLDNHRYVSFIYFYFRLMFFPLKSTYNFEEEGKKKFAGYVFIFYFN